MTPAAPGPAPAPPDPGPTSPRGSDAVWTLRRHGTPLSVCHLPSDAALPGWVSGPLTAVVRTPGELSVTCASTAVPEGTPAIGPYTGFEVAGPLDPALTGVLAGLLEPLAEAGIGVLTLSTFDTDWVLVPSSQAEAAAAEWRRRGHSTVPVPSS